jgi:hypothetical protein
MPDDEAPLVQNNLEVLLRYMDVRFTPVENSLKELRQDYKDQVATQNVLLKDISEKLSSRLDKHEERMDELEEELSAHESFISTVKWIFAALVTIATGSASIAINALVHLGVVTAPITVVPHIPPPISQAPGVIPGGK